MEAGLKAHSKANWSHAILVCAKCSKKQGAAFDGEKLAKALKKRLGGGKGRKARLGVIEVPCLDICPKKGVVLIDSRVPGQWRIVGRDVDLDGLAEELG